MRRVRKMRAVLKALEQRVVALERMRVDASAIPKISVSDGQGGTLVGVPQGPSSGEAKKEGNSVVLVLR
jgi:hypothetical protein